MLLLLFYIGENLYAIDTHPVIEVVPMVALRKVQHGVSHIAGVFNYHGAIVPAIDLCCLLENTPCQIRYSTRLIIVQGQSLSDLASSSGQRNNQFGLIAERVTETLEVSPQAFKSTESVSQSPYIGELFLTEKGMVQKIHCKHLISDAIAALPVGAEDQRNGAGVH